jgi:hypothetical protein
MDENTQEKGRGEGGKSKSEYLMKDNLMPKNRSLYRIEKAQGH